MKQTVNSYDFHRAFETLRPENFSYAGLNALFEYFESLEDDLGEEIELDVIAICCDYTEYESMAAFQDEYGDEYGTIEDIENQTTVIRIDDETDDDGNFCGAFIIQVF